MTRIDSVRRAADRTKDSVRYAAEAVAPYAGTAKDGAVHYAQQAGVAARNQYDAHLAPRVDHALDHVPPKVERAVETAARRAREGARQAADYTAPRVGQAVEATMAVAIPARDEAVVRGAAAMAALRNPVTASDIEGLVRRRNRRARTGRAARKVAVLGLLGGAGFAAWKWWTKQTNPDWLVEPAPPTDLAERSGTGGEGTRPLHSVDGSPVDESTDPEVKAKQDEAGGRPDAGDTYP